MGKIRPGAAICVPGFVTVAEGDSRRPERGRVHPSRRILGLPEEVGVLLAQEPKRMDAVDSDRSLILASLQGDRGAWEALIRRYQRLLYAIPRRHGLSEDDAADVFQTVCIKLFEKLEELRNQDRLVPWLITTATRESWRVQRQAHRTVSWPDVEAEAAGGSPPEEVPSADLPIEELILRRERDQMVRLAVQQLEPRCRTLLGWLYYTHPPPSYEEIAQRMEIPEGSVGPRRARCLRQLKRILQKMQF